MTWKRLLRLAAVALAGGMVLGMVTGALSARASEGPVECVSSCR
ncbi:hypothetical protein AB0I28_37990 [Phytomonospora sp. NPDC050363]